MTLDEFFLGWEESRRIFEALRAAVDSLGPVGLRITKSQVSFHHGRSFALAWIPDKYLRGAHAPLVLTVLLRSRDSSPRWKQIVEPAPGRFTHHLELHSEAEIDEQVRRRLQQARDEAAPGRSRGPVDV